MECGDAVWRVYTDHNGTYLRAFPSFRRAFSRNLMCKVIWIPAKYRIKSGTGLAGMTFGIQYILLLSVNEAPFYSDHNSSVY